MAIAIARLLTNGLALDPLTSRSETKRWRNRVLLVHWLRKIKQAWLSCLVRWWT